MIVPFAIACSIFCALIRRRRNFSVCVKETTYAPRSTRSRITASRRATSPVRFGTGGRYRNADAASNSCPSERRSGAYRVLTAARARDVGGFYSETEFDFSRLRNLNARPP